MNEKGNMLQPKVRIYEDVYKDYYADREDAYNEIPRTVIGFNVACDTERLHEVRRWVDEALPEHRLSRLFEAQSEKSIDFGHRVPKGAVSRLYFEVMPPIHETLLTRDTDFIRGLGSICSQIIEKEEGCAGFIFDNREIAPRPEDGIDGNYLRGF